ncbi:MAG: purine-nucleoside phosphorylase [Ignavibacteria bacterium]|nr:purine-nucleoside phosphorylase [Ignavibacteria bacterium]
MKKSLTESASFIASALPPHFHPKVAIILGSGLCAITDGMDILATLPYSTIPHFPISTVDSHRGALVLGYIGDTAVAVMQGRFHYYEGYSAEEVVFPLRVVQQLGASILLLTNACGGLNPLFRACDIMLIDDHINLQWENPLISRDERHRFPDMSTPYSSRLQSIAEQCALRQALTLRKGTYLAVTGPNYETRAELRFMRTIGADAVGMSSVPETLAARSLSMEVLGLSLITNECRPDAPRHVSHEEVLTTAVRAEQNLKKLVFSILEES